MPQENGNGGSLSRRDFLKAGGAAGAFALLAGALPKAVWAEGRATPELARLGELINPFDVAVGPDGTIFVANAGRYGVVSLAGRATRYLGAGAGAGEGRLNFPMGVAAAADGSAFVADTNNGRVQQFDGEGDFLRSFGRLGYLDGEFQRPRSVCVFGAGVLVADTRNHRIQYLDLQSERLATAAPVTRAILGGLGDGPTDLKLPGYVAAGAGGGIYVADTGHAAVKKFTLDGKVSATLGAGSLTEPTGIAVADDGTVFVADAGKARIVAFDRDGGRGRELGRPRGLRRPAGLAFSDGILLVADPAAARVFLAEV